MDFLLNQPLSVPRLGTSADTLTELYGHVLRVVQADTTVSKWPGFSNDSGRWRFQRRVPEDVRHAFGGRGFIRFPLDCTTELEAKRSALAWTITYDMAFAEARERAQPADAPADAIDKPRTTSTNALQLLSAFTAAQMRELVEPLAVAMDHRQHESIASGRASFDALVTENRWLDGAVRDVLSGRGSEQLTILSALFLTSRGITPDTKDALARFTYVHASVLQSRTVKPGGRRLDGEHVEPVRLPEPPNPLLIGAPTGLTLGKVVQDYLDRLPDNHYRRKIDLCLTLLVDTVGAGKAVKDLKQTDFRDYLELVCKLPRDWGKRYRAGTATVTELIADMDPPRLSKTTYNDNYRNALGKFLRDSHRDHGERGFPSFVLNYSYSGAVKPGRDKQRHLNEHELQRLGTSKNPRFPRR